MSIHTQIINNQPENKPVVIKLNSIDFKGKFNVFLESLRVRGLIDASASQPIAGPNRTHIWTSHLTEGLQVHTSKFPYLTKGAMEVMLVGTRDQIRETVTAMKFLEVEGIPIDVNKMGDTSTEVDVPYHTTLNPVIWSKSEDEYVINEEARLVLLKAAAEFIEHVKIPSDVEVVDITITGSSANYNWTATSDIDLHVVVDLSKVDAKYKDTVLELFKAKKGVWNEEHSITIRDVPVEFYVQDKNEKHHSTGIFSLQDGEWVTQPTHEPPTVDDVAVKSKTSELQQKIESACSSNKASVIENLYDKIVKMRKSALEKGGEFATNNIVFKQLRKSGHLDKLADCKTNTFDRELSIEDEEL